MRLLVGRCEVLYTGRLTARLPEAVRLLMFKADGSFLVHDDASGFRL
jgi:RecB family endonuclease NucS